MSREMSNHLRCMCQPHIMVVIALWFHLFPFRTEQLSTVAPMVLRKRESRSPPFFRAPRQKCFGALCFIAPPSSSVRKAGRASGKFGVSHDGERWGKTFAERYVGIPRRLCSGHWSWSLTFQGSLGYVGRGCRGKRRQNVKFLFKRSGDYGNNE